MAEERVLGGRYRLLTRLGQGGMGEVWRAVDDRLDRTVAVKLIRPGRVDTDEVVARFHREARLTARLAGHPNVVILHDFGDDSGDGAVYAVMELVAGRSLTAVLREGGPMPIARAAGLTAQAAAGLGAAHAAGIVHRDVKPGNLMVVEKGTSDGTVKVLDFGIASVTAAEASRRLTRSGQVIGTPLYMSPEQISGARVDHASDLYSLGAILYQLLAGRPPFQHSNPLTVLRMHVVDEPPPVVETRPEVPAELSELVASMLAKRPGTRPSSAEEVRERLGAFLPPVPDRPSRPESAPGRRPLVPTKAYTQAPPTRAYTRPPSQVTGIGGLQSRVEAARDRASAGHVAEAAEDLRVLLPRLAEAFGPDHPDTLRARRQEAYLTGKAGDPRSAVARLDALLTDLMRAYGSQHPETLTTRYQLATNAGRAGNHGLAARVHGDLVPDLVAVHGADSDRVLTTRLYLAFEVGEAGEPRRSVRLLEALLPDLVRVLGEDDPTTLRARHYHAAYLGHSGQPAEAVRRYRALLTDHARVHGDQHPATDRVRSHLAQWEARAQG
ncbi:serine/threonine protein kinase [Nocardiopsis sp. EMB25]|uniref:serine/threonine-protein kinase n=1 Tax=Nocardiopsis sp. EMB25 TaxID=2835867 RepID=UPI0022842AC4|nr:serine/threonine-protein kinase [Nocardiopsis sp. EMB25]MCY9783083.1 serine/threonine protein kinase [Nocardiopsis sp. EMB25]